MMKPEKAYFYVYAENEGEVRQLESALHDFVMSMYREGVIVTADRLANVIRKYGGNVMVRNFLR